jgi:hypothetical protein
MEGDGPGQKYKSVKRQRNSCIGAASEKKSL